MNEAQNQEKDDIDMYLNDILGPKEANITVLNEDEINVGENINILVKQNKGDAEINIEKCVYLLTSSQDKLGFDIYSHSDVKSFTSTNEEIVISSLVDEGSYYLHVFTIDILEYYKETVSSVIVVGHEHIYEENILVAATCLTTGIAENKCSICDESYQEEIPISGHNYNDTVVSPTCTVGGYTIHTCTYCNNTYNDTITAETGHSDSCYAITYHTHTGSTSSGGGCYTTANYGTCGGSFSLLEEWQGQLDDPYYAYKTKCSSCGSRITRANYSEASYYVSNEKCKVSVIKSYSLSCGKTPETIESKVLTCNK